MPAVGAVDPADLGGRRLAQSWAYRVSWRSLGAWSHIPVEEAPPVTLSGTVRSILCATCYLSKGLLTA